MPEFMVQFFPPNNFRQPAPVLGCLNIQIAPSIPFNPIPTVCDRRSDPSPWETAESTLTE